MDKKATSEVSWSLLMEGVSAARVETHRLKQLLKRALLLVEHSEQKDHLYQVAGDLIMALPNRIDNLERLLDRTSLGLAHMGDSFLSAKMTQSDKAWVEESLTFVGATRQASIDRVVQRHTQ